MVSQPLRHTAASTDPTDLVVLRVADARLELDLSAGARLSSLTTNGIELLGRGGPGVFDWGSFVMAPYAGRVRDGVLSFNGHVVGLPLALPPHAIHGLAYDQRWTVVNRRGASDVSVEFAFADNADSEWPFGGRVRQDISLSPRHIDFQVTVTADDQPFPATVGWHPWFRRHLDVGQPVRLDLQVGAMLAKDSSNITSAVRVEPSPGPWDDAFVDVSWPVGLNWGDAVHLDVWADTDMVVVFNEKADAVCVEPQSGAPDAVNSNPQVVEPGKPLVHRMRWAWMTA